MRELSNLPTLTVNGRARTERQIIQRKLLRGRLLKEDKQIPTNKDRWNPSRDRVEKQEGCEHAIAIARKMGKAWNVTKRPKQRMVTRRKLVSSEQNWPKRMEVWRQMQE